MSSFFSPAQREAVESFGQDVGVFAGAGSGKTSVLVERFLHAVIEHGAEPERILAITFTEKAAGEMKRRLVEESARRGLGRIRRRLENAPISTIHGFCSKVLKENPIEAGIDPFFQILSEGESEILVTKTLERIFEEEAENALWLRLLDEYGEKTVVGALRKFYDMSRAKTLEGGLFRDEPRAKEKSEIKNLILAELQTAAEEGVGKFQTAARQIARDLQDAGKRGWPLIHSVQAAAASFYKRGAVKERVEKIESSLDRWISLEVQELALPYKKEFERIFKKFEERYEGEKRRSACYDFEDLLALTRRLLSGGTPEKEAARRRCRDLFSYILLDECQDTSPVQAEIVRLVSNGGNLFVVGDPQQSIYGFRYADPKVFLSLAGGSGGKNQPLSAKRIRLAENYRARAPLLDFVNQVYERIEGDNFFEPLRPAKKFLTKKDCVIEILAVQKDADGKGRPLDALRILEARALAARIRELVDTPLSVEDGGRSRPIEYRDIAILFKKMSAAYLFEKELSDAGIPYFSLKGRGFHEKHEVRDILNFLSLVENVNSDIALAGVLRSPLFGVSDDGLFWLARHAKASGDSAPLARSLESPEKVHGLTDRDLQKVSDFKRLWEELRSQKDRFKLSEIIGEIIGRTQAEAKALTAPEGRQQVANLRRLVETAMRLEARNKIGLRDFVDYFENLSERESASSEVSIESESGNAVTLSTVHAAKGLEFPLVIVADMGGKDKKNKQGHFETLEGAGFGIQLRDPDSREFIADAAYGEIREVLEREQRAEDNRLLYVALTRAKEHLILSGAVKKESSKGEKKSPSWMDRLVRLIGLTPGGDSGEFFDFEGIPLRILRTGRSPAPVQELSRPKPTVLPPAGFSSGGTQDVKLLEALNRRIHFPFRKYEQVKDATVSDLLADWLKNEAPSAFQPDTLPETDGDRAPLEEEEIATPRNEYGTIFHKAMEYLAWRRPSRISRSDLLVFTRHLNSAEKNEISASLMALWEGPWGKTIRESRRCYPELPFIYKTKYGILKGQIDLVVEGRDGEWVILDYKTNRIDAGETAPLAKIYEFQLSLYALVFTRLYGKFARRGVLYFASPDKTYEIAYRKEDFYRFEERMNRCYRRFAGLPDVLSAQTA